MSHQVEEFKRSAELADTRITELNARVQSLESQLSEKKSKSGLVMGLPSTMGDDWQLNLRHLMERGVKVQPNSEVVTKIAGGYHRLTYVELQKRATKLASALSKAGIKLGDRVGTFMWNNSRHFQLYYAVPCMGAVLHTLNLRLHPRELTYIITHAEDKMLFVDATLLPLFERLPAETFAKVEKIVICGPNEATGNWKSSLPNTVDFDEFWATGDDTYDWPDLDERTAMSLCYTSGTTGNPKGVLYSHRSTFLHTMECMGTDVLGVSGADCLLPIVPMFHALCWCTPFHALALGYKYLLYNCFRMPGQILEMMVDEACTVTAGVPTVLNGMMVAMQTDPTKYESLKGVLNRALCGGTAPPRSMIKFFWDKWNIEVIHGWGMTEMNPVGSVGRRVCRRRDLTKTDEELLDNQCRQGLPCAGVQFRFANPDNIDEDIKDDGTQLGEVLVKGPWITTSYYKIDRSDKFYKGWLRTGDIAVKEDACVVLKDRSKDLIKSGGEWISSQDIENHVAGLSAVLQACCIGVAHPKFDERPVIIVTLHEKSQLTLEEVRQHCLKKFSKFQCPDELLVWDKMPLTGTGKISKKDIRVKLTEDKYQHPSLRK